MDRIRFNKDDAERIAATLASTEGGMEPPGDKWTPLAMIQIAGVCLFGAMTHGTIRPGHPASHLLAPEHREAVKQDFHQDPIEHWYAVGTHGIPKAMFVASEPALPPFVAKPLSMLPLDDLLTLETT